MYKYLSILLIFIGITFVSCGSKNMQYQTANGYFVKNTFEDGKYELKISDRQTFDSIFGVGKTMNNTPTEIDFEHQFVIAVIYQLTDLQTEMKPEKLVRKNDDLVFDYEVKIGAQQSYTIRPSLLILADKNDENNVIFLQKTILMK
jgi:major membrane immunogen (membrane-anchored lipoprotein)